MKKLNESQQILSIVGGGLVLCLAAGGGVWWATGLVEEKEQEIVNIEQQIKTAEMTIKKIPNLEERVIVLRENVSSYVKILPDQAEITDFIRTISKFEGLSGASIAAYNPSQKKPENSFEKYLYQISLDASTWQFMRFISLVESFDRFIKIKSFRLNSADGKRGARNAVATSGALQHSVSMELETFVYLGKEAGGNVQIPNYSGKRERLREEIKKNSQGITLARYDYKEGRPRRDPFVDPRQASSGPAENLNNSAEAQQNTIDVIAAEVSTLQQVHARFQNPNLTFLDKFKLEKALEKQVLEVQRRIIEVESKELISRHSRYFDQWRHKVIDPFQVIRDGLIGVEAGDSWLSESEFRELDGDMRADLARGELESAKARFRAVEDRLRVPVGDPRYPWSERLNKLNLQLEILAQFVKIPLEISGVVFQESGKSGLLVNGQSYEEGDYLSATLLLKSVGRESAEFVYKGYNVVKSW